MTSDLSQEQKE